MKTYNEIQPDVLKKAHAGDKDNLDSVARVAQSRLTGYVRRVTLDDNLTEDIVQDSMLDMFKVFGKITTIEHLWGRLYLIANSKIKNHYGRQWRRATKYLADVEGEVVDTKSPDGLTDVVTAELKQIVNDSVNKLEPRQRAVITMRCYENMSYRDIGKALDCNQLAARALFFRAKSSLAKNLANSGLGKGSLVLALVVFGKLTAPSEAAAAKVTIGTSTLSVGAAGTTIGLLGTKTAIAAITAAGLITAGTLVMTPGKSQESSLPQSTQIVSSSVSSLYQNEGTQEHWYYYPKPTSDIVMTKIIRCDKDGANSYCQWLQNQSGNLYFDGKTVNIVNSHAWSKDLRVILLPTDPQRLKQFIADTQKTPTIFNSSFIKCNGNQSGLLLVAHSNDGKVELSDPTYHDSIMSENYFNFDWPVGTEKIDLRDPMHQRGWCCFEIIGNIGGKNISGQGQMPFVYATYKLYPPHLSIAIDGQQYTDCEAGILFQGLSRPWQGLHTIDSIRRDAAKQLLPFETILAEDGKKATVVVAVDDNQMTYTVDMERDLLESITLSGSIEGALKFTYTANTDDYRNPNRNRLPSQPLKGLNWWLQIANE